MYKMLYVNKQRTDSKAKYNIIPEHSFLYNPQIVIVAKSTNYTKLQPLHTVIPEYLGLSTEGFVAYPVKQSWACF